MSPVDPVPLLVVTFLGVGLVVLLITWLRMPAFLALAAGSLFVGLAAGMPLTEIPRAFQQGVGDTLGFVAMVIGLGTVIGKLLAESGGAVVVSRALIRALGERRLDWALMLSAFIIGLPVFFQVGLVLLAPVLFTLTRQTGMPLLWLGIPMVAGLSAAHGLVPPHPGPLAAIERLGADPGRTLFYSLIVGLPIAAVAGPLFGRLVSRRIHLEPGPMADQLSSATDNNGGSSFTAESPGLKPLAVRGESPASTETGDAPGPPPHRAQHARRGPRSQGATSEHIPPYVSEEQRSEAAGSPTRVSQRVGVQEGCSAGRMPAEFHHGLPAHGTRRTPSLAVTLTTVLLPVLLMLLAALTQATLPDGLVRRWTGLAGTPLVAMLLATLLSLYTFGRACGFDRARLLRFTEDALPPIAGVLLVVGAGGGFGRVLDAAGSDTAIAQVMGGLQLSPLVLGWVIAALLRLSVGSATVAVVTAASIMAPIATATAGVNRDLLVVSIGAGSLIASHVNDGGFWLVKEYFNMTVAQTVATWTVLETIISVAGLAGVLMLSLVVG